MRAALCILLAVAVVGCGGGSTQNLPKDPPPALASRCTESDGLDAKLVWFRAGDGALLDGAVIGDGETAVVLAHGYPSDLCPWLPYAKTLAAHGYLALAFDFRGAGSSAPQFAEKATRFDLDVKAAYDEARRLGAKKVFLMGASFGGAAVLAEGAQMGSDPAGIISLSGPTNIATRLDTVRFAPQMRAPLLVLLARHDPVVSVAQSRALVAAAGSEDKRIATYDGSWHAWDLLYSAPYRERVSALILEFLRERSGG